MAALFKFFEKQNRQVKIKILNNFIVNSFTFTFSAVTIHGTCLGFFTFWVKC